PGVCGGSKAGGSEGGSPPIAPIDSAVFDRISMTARSSLTIVLAAGEGTRMRSSLPKVLHPVAHQSLLAHVLAAAPKGTGTSLAVVIGPDHQAVADEARRIRPDALTFVQSERLGTAHAA